MTAVRAPPTAERLLSVGAVEVAVVEPMALADERQDLRGVELVDASGEARARVTVGHGVVQTDGDPPRRLGDVVEPDEADHGESVDGHAVSARTVADGLRATGVPALGHQLDRRSVTPCALSWSSAVGLRRP